MNWTKFFAVSSILTILHYGEDVLLLWLGRFTHIDFILLLLFPIVFGLVIASLVQIKQVKIYLNDK
jgi:hypothetical protein